MTQGHRGLLARGLSPQPEERYRTCVPLLSLQAAAGAFMNPQQVEVAEWVVPATNRNLRDGMFVTQVVGKSMEPRIPDGAYCLFMSPVVGSRQGRIVLAQHRDIQDPETGGSYTVKRYESEKVQDSLGSWRHVRIQLVPINPAFSPIVLTEDNEGQVAVIAEFVEVLGMDEHAHGREGDTGIQSTNLTYGEGARDLLAQWHDLTPLINEACQRLHQVFGPDVSLALARVDDPEDTTENPSLFLMVWTKAGAAQAGAMLDRFDDDFWLDNMDRAGGRLHISLEFYNELRLGALS